MYNFSFYNIVLCTNCFMTMTDNVAYYLDGHNDIINYHQLFIVLKKKFYYICHKYKSLSFPFNFIFPQYDLSKRRYWYL